MISLPDSQDPPAARRATSRLRRWGLRLAVAVGTLALAFVIAGLGFVGFLSQLRASEEGTPARADGIVVLTGGSSRVSDAIDLLARGDGQRLLISGVHRANSFSDISRSLPDSDALLKCCVDLDHSAVNTRSNASETRRWVHQQNFHSLLVVTSNYHMPRAIVELSHAMPDITLIPFSVVGEKWREEPWWASGAAMRLLLSEYVKYLAAEVRVRLDRFGLSGSPETQTPEPPAAREPAHQSATASTR
jgi:uncharacterized SAM-binding protein YcdF (DUF218 family)